MKNEEILNKVATRMMHEWNINKFKLSHKRLFDVIIESMDEYAGVQVKKLNAQLYVGCENSKEVKLKNKTKNKLYNLYVK